jgi:branched-chain amino acid transport system ATP-binding protein
VSALLQVTGLCKSFGAVRAMRSVSLEVEAGQVAGVIGPNGAGKTTLFNALTGFSRADEGTVRFDGADITRLSPHRIAQRGLVRTFQATRPLHSENVRENVVTGTHLSARGGLLAALFTSPRIRRQEVEQREVAEGLLAMTGLADVTEALPRELTGGQLRLLEIARALAARPKLVLLDEPAAGLNQTETRALEKTLLRVRDEGTTLVIVEHDVELVFRLCDQVTVLNFGEVLRGGSPEEIRRDPDVAEAYFGTRHEQTRSDVRG